MTLDEKLFVFTILMVTIAVVILVVMMITYGRGYRRGQIDALSGAKVRYRLSRRPDGSMVWRDIPFTTKL